MKIDHRYVAGLILAFCLRILLGGFSGNALFWIAILLFGAALIEYILFSRALRAEFRIPEGRVEAGDPFRLALNLENRGFLTMPFLQAEAPELRDLRQVSLKAGDREAVTYDFRPMVRGIIEVGAIRISFSDVLNILTGSREFGLARIKVYPKVPEAGDGDSLWNSVGEGNLFKIFSRENPYTVREMRRYQPGDSIQKINWKVSARYGELFVKRGETTEENNILLVLDMNREILAMDRQGIYENSLVTAALTLSKSLLGRGIRHGFLMSGSDRPFSISSGEGYQQLEEYLILNKADEKRSLADFVQTRKEFLLERGTLIFFSRPLERDIKACEQLKHHQNEVIFCAPLLAGSGVERKGRQLVLHDLGGEGYEMA